MKRWVITATIDPTKLTGVVSGRFEGEHELSGSVLFVYFSKALRRWEHVFAGSARWIDEPTLIFVEEDWTRENRTLGQRVKIEIPPRIEKGKDSQLSLDL